MDPANIPFNVLIVGPTNSGKTQFLVNQLCGPFCGKFDYVVLICPTFAYNKTLYRFAVRDPRLYVIICEQHEVEIWLKAASLYFEGTNTLIVLDDCATSKDMKGDLDRGPCQTRIFIAPCRHQRVGADPAALQHRETFSRKRGGDRAVLHAIGQNHEGHLRRIRGRAFTCRAQADDCKVERTQVRPFDFFAAASFLYSTKIALRYQWSRNISKKPNKS